MKHNEPKKKFQHLNRIFLRIFFQILKGVKKGKKIKTNRSAINSKSTYKLIILFIVMTRQFLSN